MKRKPNAPFYALLLAIIFLFSSTNVGTANALSVYTLTTLSLNGNQAQVTVTKNINSGANATLFILSYDPSNTLNAIHTQPISLNLGESRTYYATVTIHSGETIKAFVWDTVASMKPLSNTVVFDPLHPPLPTASPTPTPSPTPIPTASPTPIPTPSPTPPRTVLGFTTYYYAGDSSSYTAMVAHKSDLDQIVTATHVVDGLGNISGVVPSNQLTYAKANNITPYLMIGNDFNSTVAKTLLESTANRLNFLNNLKTVLSANQYQGVNIDLENVLAANRTHYTLLLNELYTALKPLGYHVSASVPAKTLDSPAYSWTYAYDYATLSNYVDKLVIMAYDEHYPGGSPGAVASINWVTSVVNYTKTVVPKEKISLGVAAYGYDWSTLATKAYSIAGCYTLAANNGATVVWDTATQSPHFTYTDVNGIVHQVWFENAVSLGYKLDLVMQHNLEGIAIWRLGLENNEFWTAIRARIR